MRRFADLFDRIDRTTSTSAKVEAIREYLTTAPREDAAWAVYFLMGRRIKRLVKSDELHGVVMELTGLPGWLLGECYQAVGDSAEMWSLVLCGTGALAEEPEDVPLHVWVEERIEALRIADGGERRAMVRTWLAASDAREVFLVLKLLTGEMRVGVSATLVTRAVAMAAGVEQDLAAHRLMGDWRPSADFLGRVFSPRTGEDDATRPYPFYLASPVDFPPEGEPAARAIERQLGDSSGYQVEWKWDGIRCQLIRRGSRVVLWSRGEDIVTERFPEVTERAARLQSGTVLDGEILAYKNGKPLAFAKLQRRIGRQGLTPAILAESPVAFMAYDILEHEGRDVRGVPLEERRSLLERLLAKHPTQGQLVVSERVQAESWDKLARIRSESRSRGVEGLMLKLKSSPYGVGRERGAWWKWKIDPYSIDAVLVYAQPGHGRRAGLLTDYTFAVWDGEELVPVAKAYSGLSNEEIATLDTWLRSHTVERFGPVRVVKPEQVFELHFEGIAASSRHRSGVAFRFPRMARWRDDKPARDADTLATVRRLLVESGGTAPEPTIFELGLMDERPGDPGVPDAEDDAGVDDR